MDDFSLGVHSKLTFRATRSEPADVAVAELGGCGRTAIVDARALGTAIGVVEALLLKFAPCAMIETIASTSAEEVSPMSAAVFPVDLSIEYLS